jgi:tRNA (mo5U34)-methyltransferase
MSENTLEINEKINEVPIWWHSISLGDNIITPGHKTPAIQNNELEAMKIPDLQGKTVLDIGAWDGFYSFEAEKRGASRVVALDHFIWSIDIPQMRLYKEKCKKDKVIPLQAEQIPEIWKPAQLPGKKGFDTARGLLKSKVEPVVGNFMEMDLDLLGTFDIVFFMGVLYHLQNPLEGLKKLHQVTKELAIIETEAIVLEGLEHLAFCEFYESNELHDDNTNWWVPNEKALVGMCRAAGFRKVDIMLKPFIPPAEPLEIPPLLQRIFKPQPAPGKAGVPFHYRAFAHAWK